MMKEPEIEVSRSFLESLGKVAQMGGGLLAAPVDLDPKDYRKFWAEVADIMRGSGWKLAPSGYRDAGATRNLVPE